MLVKIEGHPPLSVEETLVAHIEDRMPRRTPYLLGKASSRRMLRWALNTAGAWGELAG
jgi:hypothetical protein